MYKEKVRKYVEKTLLAAITVSFAHEMNNKKTLEEKKLELLEDIAHVSGLTDKLVDMITDHTMNACESYIKLDLPEPKREEHYMNAVQSFCHSAQCLNLAYYFKEDAKAQLTTGKSR